MISSSRLDRRSRSDPEGEPYGAARSRPEAFFCAHCQKNLLGLISSARGHTPGGAAAISNTLVEVTEPLRAGLTYPVTFTFARAGELHVELPIDNPAVLPPRAGDAAESRV
jgi:hypothetical protein